ncbi:MAG: hypothetical protein Q4E24_09840 [bacterium]|nr:hypothetical protein [bacterium]
MQQFLKQQWKSVLCILFGIILFLAMEAEQRASITGGYLKRNSYGEGEENYELEVKGLGDTAVPVNFILGEQAYAEEQVKAVFDSEYERLCTDILGENSSLQEIRYPLALEENTQNRGIRFSWSSEDSSILNDEGVPMLSYLEREGQEVCLRVCMTDGKYTADYEMKLMVLPPPDTLQERLREFLIFLQEEEEAQRTEEIFILPTEYQGRSLSYKHSSTEEPKIFLMLGVLAALALYFQKPVQERKRIQKRKKQMMSDYSEIVSKLLVFLGAGYTVRGAWENIVKEYTAKKYSQEGEVRYAYEEMSYTYGQISSGMYESKAYGEFGRRCGLHMYMKLGCLLEQNLRTGTKNLRSLLENEMQAALQQRRELAKKAGEEAGTKLLFPMVMMLGVVMVIVVVPAFMGL